MQVFSELVRSIQKTQAELVLSIEEKQRQTERWAQGFINELEQEIAELKKRKTDLENVSRTDHIHFLKVREHFVLITKLSLLSNYNFHCNCTYVIMFNVLFLHNFLSLVSL